LLYFATTLFSDDFEAGLERWELSRAADVEIHQVGGEHGAVLRLRPNGDVHALIKGSERWGNVALEGQVLFPEDSDSYLGLLYDFRRHGKRTDFGLIYLKYGNKTYLQPNPHRDYNVSRTFYPEFKAPLAGPESLRAGEWQRFRAEIADGICHVYVGDVATPQLTFPIAESERGSLGFQPRSVGGDVWVDNVTVTALERHSYTGPPRPASAAIVPDPASLRWEVLGPLARTEDDVARDPDSAKDRWRPFELDPRSGIETGRVVDFHGPEAVAYFRATTNAEVAGPAVLHVSSCDDLALWVNGRFHTFLQRASVAWSDYWRNPKHHGEEVPIKLIAGENEIVFRVRGGSYATGGFFARVERQEPTTLDWADSLEARNVRVDRVKHEGRNAVRLRETVEPGAGPDASTMALLADSSFTEGTIELEVAGVVAPGAQEGARGFVGLAFHVQKDVEHYKAFYLRPTNGRAEDQLRRNHATQYVAQPEWPWHRLRNEEPGVYESYVDLEPGWWTQLRIEVTGDRALLFVHGAEQPTLIVNDLKSKERGGRIALWIGPGSVGYFTGLRVTGAGGSSDPSPRLP